jgi:hypothetical protein
MAGKSSILVLLGNGLGDFSSRTQATEWSTACQGTRRLGGFHQRCKQDSDWIIACDTVWLNMRTQLLGRRRTAGDVRSDGRQGRMVIYAGTNTLFRHRTDRGVIQGRAGHKSCAVFMENYGTNYSGNCMTGAKTKKSEHIESDEKVIELIIVRPTPQRPPLLNAVRRGRIGASGQRSNRYFSPDPASEASGQCESTDLARILELCQ